MRKLLKATEGRVSLLTYLTGAAAISAGAALIYVPAGVIAGGALLIALVFEG